MVVPSAQLMIEVPEVVPLAQVPFPVGIGSWNCSPAAPVTTFPAETVPVVGALGSLAWQPVRIPLKL